MNKPRCILVDIDGTLADTSHRIHHLNKTPKDWENWNGSMEKDEPKTIIVEIVKLLAEKDIAVLLVTGRFEAHRKKTLKWLLKHNIPFNAMYMRKNGDFRSDHIIKQEIFRETIQPMFDTIAAFEDRKSVVDMWREAGLVCLQVAEGDF